MTRNTRRKNAPDSGKNTSVRDNNASVDDNNASASDKIGRTRRKKEPISRTVQAELDLNERLAQAATRPEFTRALTRVGIPAAEVSGFGTETTRCRNLLNRALQERAQRSTFTRTESQLEADLIVLVRRVQAAALQKYDTDPQLRPRLSGYYIGATLTRNHANLAQYSQGILQSLQNDTLPGIDQTRQDALAQTRQDWLAANESQAQSREHARQHQEDAVALLENLRALRLRMQYAIDGEFPPNLPESAAARASFQLPLNRPFRAPSRR